jgi:hypothetical protein
VHKNLWEYDKDNEEMGFMDIIYHYKSIDTIHSILKKYRTSKDKQNLEFWASNIYALNDPMEMIAASNVIVQVLEKIENELQVDNTKRLSSFFDDIESVKEAYIRTFNRDQYLFIMSFSSCRDTLPMWSMYGKNGKGICLCFDREEILNSFDEDARTKIANVSYGLTRIDDVTMNLLKETYRNYLSEIDDEFIEDKENVRYFYRYFFIRTLAPIYKDAAYDYEGEQRLVCEQQKHDDTIDFKISSAGYVIPYRKIKIPVKALKEIIVGPSYNFDLLKKGLNLELILSGVNGVKVIKSEINYRSI